MEIFQLQLLTFSPDFTARDSRMQPKWVIPGSVCEAHPRLSWKTPPPWASRRDTVQEVPKHHPWGPTLAPLNLIDSFSIFLLPLNILFLRQLLKRMIRWKVFNHSHKSLSWESFQRDWVWLKWAHTRDYSWFKKILSKINFTESRKCLFALFFSPTWDLVFDHS